MAPNSTEVDRMDWIGPKWIK